MSQRLSFAGVADIPVISTLVERAFDPRFGEAWSAAQLRSTLSLPGSWAQVIDAGAAAVGFSLCRRAGPEAELLLVGVTPASRGCGTATILLDAAFDTAISFGVETMFLEVRDGNSAAQRLYLRTGFVAVGRRRDYYRGHSGEAFDAITMRRQLQA